MESCPCSCSRCRCVGKCFCCPECCVCTKCRVLEKDISCSKCKERLNSHAVAKQSAAYPLSIVLMPQPCLVYPNVDFRRLPDLSFLNSNIPPEALGNPSRESRLTVNSVNIQTSQYNNPTLVRQESSESRTSQEDQPLMFPIDDIDNPEHSETKDSTEQTPLRMELYGSLQDIHVNFDSTESSVTLDYSQDSPTEMDADLQSSSAPTKFLIEFKSNESSPSRLVGPRYHISTSRRGLCFSAPPRTTAPRPFFSPASSTKSTSPRSTSPTESCTQSSSTTMSIASQVEASASRDTTESKKAGDLTSNKRTIVGTSDASTSPRVSLGPLVQDPNYPVQVLVSSAKDQQTSSPESVKENSSLKGSLIEVSDTEVGPSTLPQSAERQSVSSQRSDSPTCPSCGGPVSQLIIYAYSPEPSEASQSLNSSPGNNGGESNILSPPVSSEDNDPEINASIVTSAQEQVSQAVANRPVVHAGNVLVLMILFNLFRLH